MVANVADLKQLIRWHLDGRNDNEPPASFKDGEACFAASTCLMFSKAVWRFRVVNSASEFPVALEPINAHHQNCHIKTTVFSA